MSKEVYTITYGEQAENHVGMEKIGELSEKGFDLSDLKKAQEKFNKIAKTELINLTHFLKNKDTGKESNIEAAHLLIIRNGVDGILKSINKTHNDLYKEHQNIEYDNKAFMYGRVVNKIARHNVCFDDKGQTPDIKNGKGTIIAFKKAKLTNHIRKELPNYLGEDAECLKAEGNHYYDISKCGIGFHGDGERLKVIGVRIGNVNLPLHYQWFYKSKPVGERIILDLKPGDMYIMSEKTTGNDWKKKNIFTLRHATGPPRFITIKPKPLSKTGSKGCPLVAEKEIKKSNKIKAGKLKLKP